MVNSTENILEIREAYKSYDSKKAIFKGFNMTVEKGTIYALLGPSGCGKTTLLKCIIGRARIDAGEIILGVNNRSQLGYMPQDLSLVGELTIKETLNCYGWMHNIKSNKIEERKKDLFPYLEIPPENSKIKDLSGGQKRRVSLCIALFHNPDLLILDEPTVGIDPVLSHSIWQRLIEMSTVHKKTIILTTHYIEEAKQSDKVGMMRGGVLVVEGKAESIMNQYDCNTLEQAFIQLSYKQEIENHGSDIMEKYNYPAPLTKPKLPLNKGKLFSVNGFMSYFLKNMYLLKNDFIGWFLMFVIPVSTCAMYHYGIGNVPVGLKLGIINDELLNHTDCFNFSNSTCFLASCGYLSLLQEKRIVTVPYKNVESAVINTKKNKIWGFVHISENFTQSLYERIFYSTTVNDSSIKQSEINVTLDMSNNIIGSFLKYYIYSTFFNYFKILSETCEWPTHHSNLPIQFREPVYGNSDSSFSEFGVSGVLILLEFFLPVAYVIPLLKDKREGVIERSLISGLSNLEILSAYSASTMVFFILQTVCNMLMLFGVFGHVFEGSYILALILLFFVGTSGMCFGISIGVLCDNDVAAAFLIVGGLVSFSFLSGVVWPIEGMHYSLQSLSWFLPLSNPTQALRAIIGRAWSLSHPVVYNGFISATAWICVFSFFTLILVKMGKGMGHIGKK